MLDEGGVGGTTETAGKSLSPATAASPFPFVCTPLLTSAGRGVSSTGGLLAGASSESNAGSGGRSVGEAGSGGSDGEGDVGDCGFAAGSVSSGYGLGRESEGSWCAWVGSEDSLWCSGVESVGAGWIFTIGESGKSHGRGTRAAGMSLYKSVLMILMIIVRWNGPTM